MMKKAKYIFILCLLFMSTVSFGQESEAFSNPIKVSFQKAPVKKEVAKKESDIPLRPIYRALIIGVSNYKYAGPGLPNLDQPVIDASNVASVLEEKYSFDTTNVVFLKNPTREDLINALDQLANISQKDDNVLIFYAGHGFYDEKKGFGYWLPSDAEISSRSRWVANSTIKDYIGAINSKHTLLIADACFGGSIFKTRALDASAMLKISQLYKKNSRKAITSGNLSQVPDKSIFVKYFLKTLRENEDELLPLSTLFTRMYEPVLNNSPNVPQMGVIQGTGDEGGDFVFVQKGF